MKHPSRLAYAAALLSAPFLLSSARAEIVGSGKVISETRAVSDFHGVELGGSGELIITQGDSEGLVIEAEDNLLPLLESKVKDGVLYLGLKAHESVHATKPMIFKLAANKLDQVELSGSGKVRAGRLTAASAAITLAGSGDINIENVQTDELTATVEGSGQLHLSGSAKAETVESDGSGEYAADGLRSETASVSINGSGSCELWTEKSLQVSINGSGGVDYHGSPAVVQRINGSGQVHSRGAKSP